MALIKCRECGNEISDKASNCPNCGCPVQQNKVCRECGNTLYGNEISCSNCGCPINNNSNKTSFNAQKEEKNSLCLAGLIVGIICLFIDFWGLVAAAGLTLSILGLNKSTNPKDSKYATIGIVLSSIELFLKVIQIISLISQGY